MVLIDTSSWIHLFRSNGDTAVRARVESLLRQGTACLCPMVRLELWNGARAGSDKKMLRDFERILPELPITEDVWNLAYSLAEKSRSAGVSIPGPDILIAACAQFHDAALEHADADFDLLSRLKD